MNYSQTDLDDFINMLVSSRSFIETNKKPHPYIPDHTRSIIILQNVKMLYSLFPEQNSLLLGLTENNNKSAYDKIYGMINTKLPGLDITYIDVRLRRPLIILEITMKSNKDSKGGKKKRHTKKIKSTKKKRHIKKKNYTKTRR